MGQEWYAAESLRPPFAPAGPRVSGFISTDGTFGTDVTHVAREGAMAQSSENAMSKGNSGM
jgi:hypothetical protein